MPACHACLPLILSPRSCTPTPRPHPLTPPHPPPPPPAEEGKGYLRTSSEKLPGHALGLSMGKVWEVVREHKDLNLPAHRVCLTN